MPEDLVLSLVRPSSVVASSTVPLLTAALRSLPLLRGNCDPGNWGSCFVRSGFCLFGSGVADAAEEALGLGRATVASGMRLLPSLLLSSWLWRRGRALLVWSGGISGAGRTGRRVRSTGAAVGLVTAAGRFCCAAVAAAPSGESENGESCAVRDRGDEAAGTGGVLGGESGVGGAGL